MHRLLHTHCIGIMWAYVTPSVGLYIGGNFSGYPVSTDSVDSVCDDSVMHAYTSQSSHWFW